jgi:hypothetical protein
MPKRRKAYQSSGYRRLDVYVPKDLLDRIDANYPDSQKSHVVAGALRNLFNEQAADRPRLTTSRPGKDKVRIAASMRVEKEVVQALLEYILDQNVKPSVAGTFVLAMREFLERKGYLPRKS